MEQAGEARRARVARATRETDVTVELALDGSGRCEAHTGVPFLDHMLDQIARHGLFDLTVRATGDLEIDAHHTVEDTGIVLGRAFAEALGDARGIRRMGHAIVPMDEALALVAVDLSGRGYAVIDVPFAGERIGTMDADLLRHFWESLATAMRATLHIRVLAGTNDHHKAEACFKALARALDQATELDPRRADQVPSTKGTLGS
jgi:imidazoleglycerol-phosphate dehydratase